MKNLQKALKAAGKTQVDLAKALEINPSAINRWVKGRVEPTARAIIQIAEYLGVSTDYLLGISTEGLSSGEKIEIEAKIEGLKASLSGLPQAAAVAVPLLDDPIAAGEPVPISGSSSENRYFIEKFLKRFHRPLLLQVGEGQDSMIPVIFPGDLLLIDRAPVTKPKRGGIYAVNLPDGGTVKYAGITGAGLRLTSENKAYKPVDLPLDSVNINDIIVGRVVWIGREMKDNH